MENLTLEQLSLKYFEMEREIDKMNIKKQEYEKEITEQYNNKGKIWTLIKKKQQEQEQAIKDQQIKLKEAIEAREKQRREKRSQKILRETEERLARQKDKDDEERKLYWFAIDGTKTPKTPK
jgi:hypothetical protein